MSTPAQLDPRFVYLMYPPPLMPYTTGQNIHCYPFRHPPNPNHLQTYTHASSYAESVHKFPTDVSSPSIPPPPNPDTFIQRQVLLSSDRGMQIPEQKEGAGSVVKGGGEREGGEEGRLVEGGGGGICGVTRHYKANATFAGDFCCVV